MTEASRGRASASAVPRGPCLIVGARETGGGCMQSRRNWWGAKNLDLDLDLDLDLALSTEGGLVVNRWRRVRETGARRWQFGTRARVRVGPVSGPVTGTTDAENRVIKTAQRCVPGPRGLECRGRR